MVSQYFLGSFSRSVNSVSWGFFVLTYPKRLVIRWTWVSTQMPGFLYPRVTTRFAVLRPTPFNFNNSSISCGYQVCEKWLKDRKGRKLSLDEIKHYCNIITTIKKTLEIQEIIDGMYLKIEDKTIWITNTFLIIHPYRNRMKTHVYNMHITSSLIQIHTNDEMRPLSSHARSTSSNPAPFHR